MEDKQTQSAVIYILAALLLFMLYCIMTTEKRPQNGYIKEIPNKTLNQVEGDKYLND